MAPHPDDSDVVGVTLRHFFRAGCRITISVLTSGSSGVEDRFCPEDPSPQHKARLRREEQARSIHFFGLSHNCLNFPETEEDTESHLMDSGHNLDIFVRTIVKEQPDAIFMPHGNDTNIDHRLTCELVKRALEQIRPCN